MSLESSPFNSHIVQFLFLLMGYLPSEMYSLALSHLQRVTTTQDKSQGLCELPKMGQEGLVHNEAQMTPLPSLPISAV